MEFSNILVLLFYIFLFYKCLIISAQTIDCDSTEIQKLCLDQETCDTCIQTHVCCNWCYDQTITGRKCNIKSQLVGCNPDKIETNSQEGIEIKKNDPFTVIESNTNLEEIIQIRPQHAKLKLRKGLPVNFTFTYKPAENYPLDLYYLGDLSFSMSETLKVFKSLGKDLPGNLTQLTTNYRLAYGSFVDKPGMPFYFTDSFSFNNPCYREGKNCEKGYLFKHRLDFTKDANTFLDEVKNSNLTANVDDLDGALDAILQILNCDDIIGFSKSSRKIILLPTDSLLHTAGDGILVGAALKPTGECFLDEDGEHSQPLKYDYPSLEQIESLLREKKANIIFAVKTENKFYYYRNMTKHSLKGYAYVAELEEQSQNILDLIRSGFYSFAGQVSFSINKTQHENLDVQFFADCENRNYFNETSICYNVKDEPVTFKVQITFNEMPQIKGKDIIYIEEKNINEKIQLEIEYLGKCKCQNYGNVTAECLNGEQRCGECVCNRGWTGEYCAETCKDTNINACRSNNADGTPSRICSGCGECECEKCICEPPFTGEFCEHECPSKRSKREYIICGGTTKGTCFKGYCICKAGYTGNDCSCSTSQSDCSFGGSIICSGHGECVCNECQCQDNFTGKYCEKSVFSDNNTICKDFESAVNDFLLNNGTKEIIKNDHKIKIIDEGEKEEFSCGINIDCRTTTDQSSSYCTIESCYFQGENKSESIVVARKICAMAARVFSLYVAAAIIGAIIILGLVFIIGYKVNIHRKEIAEYKLFKEEKKNAVEMNPIYKNPVVEYSNPLRAKTD